MQESPARHLNLSGASNFRDLGGYAGRDGRTVRWRKLFRSNHLGHLTSADIAVLRQLGVKSAFDFRGKDERIEALCSLDDIETHSLPVEPTVVAALRAIHATGRRSTADDALEVMRDSYRGYVEHNTPRFRALFAHLLEDRAPLVIHCTAGKDRTGLMAMLLLGALGVSDDDIVVDYELTTQYRSNRRLEILGPEIEKAGVDLETVRPYLTAFAPVMVATIDRLHRDYGSIEAFLLDRAELDSRTLSDLRASLLEAVKP